MDGFPSFGGGGYAWVTLFQIFCWELREDGLASTKVVYLPEDYLIAEILYVKAPVSQVCVRCGSSACVKLGKL